MHAFRTPGFSHGEVQDIVINFDDAAASATFTVLAELAKKTQVLFFTHHEHLLESARRVLGAGNFQAHVLPGASTRAAFIAVAFTA